MKKHITALLTIVLLPSAVPAQVAVQPYQRLPDVRLNEHTIHKSVFDYLLPPAVTLAASACNAQDKTQCLAALGALTASPDAKEAAAAHIELAYVYFNTGDNKRALEHINLAEKLDREDAFIPLSKAWFLISSGKYKEAAIELEAMHYLTGDFELLSSANLAKAFLNARLKNEKAQEHFAYIYSTNPYLISLSSYMIARISYNIGNKKNIMAAKIFAQQAINHDENNFPDAKLLADIAYKEGDFNTAWQYYAMLRTRDPGDKTISKRIKKLNKKDLPNKTLFIAQLNQPMVRVYESIESPLIKMALYARPSGGVAELQSFEIVSGAAISIIDEKLGEVLKTNPAISERIIFDQQYASLVVKDRYGQTKFATKRPVTITPQKGFTVLVKNVKSADIYEADFSDKELKGTVTVNTRAGGFTLVNNVSVEDVLPSLLIGAAQNILHSPEALDALAITVRSYLYAKTARAGQSVFDITDNEPGLKFGGINLEANAVKKAAANTKHLILDGDNFDFYKNCMTYGEDAKTAHSAPEFVYSPSNVFKYILSNPPEDLLSAPHDPTAWAPLKWAYYYDGKDIERRVKSFHNIGALRAIEIVETTAYGRVQKVVFKGSKGRFETADFPTLSLILGAGTLRSPLLNIIPFYKGKNINGVLVLGVDTGLGKGMCVQAAHGLDDNYLSSKQILQFFYPGQNIITAGSLPAQEHGQEPVQEPQQEPALK